MKERNLTLDKLRDTGNDEMGRSHATSREHRTEGEAWCSADTTILESSIQPITRTVLHVRLSITPGFRRNDRVVSGEPQQVVFTIPIFEPMLSQNYIRAVSDRWLGSEAVCMFSFQHLILHERCPTHTELLDLQLLPVTASGNREYESLYKFTHFNPIQTQIFHILYHTETNLLLGGPTGSSKTIAAEMAIFRVFNKYPTSKVVCIASLKALVRERIEDWKIRIEEKLGRKVVELTGDVTPDMRAIAQADMIVTTPEKWDRVSHSWQNHSYVQKVALFFLSLLKRSSKYLSTSILSVNI
ncbi:activating signal cointegrator 1 complex subunit 3-like [Carassius auratus]|uniref:Activating signal cointegrator 1 complex subunit 3-like n=1 Tax=Carassius auratus TaxID=7957 RepID=A0A6P6PZR2_CARAU|nr:activating signal cointegrator 1 complex subunit 3-like [Carassius auratus]